MFIFCIPELFETTQLLLNQINFLKSIQISIYGYWKKSRPENSPKSTIQQKLKQIKRGQWWILK